MGDHHCSPWLKQSHSGHVLTRTDCPQWPSDSWSRGATAPSQPPCLHNHRPGPPSSTLRLSTIQIMFLLAFANSLGKSYEGMTSFLEQIQGSEEECAVLLQSSVDQYKIVILTFMEPCNISDITCFREFLSTKCLTGFWVFVCKCLVLAHLENKEAFQTYCQEDDLFSTLSGQVHITTWCWIWRSCRGNHLFGVFQWLFMSIQVLYILWAHWMDGSSFDSIP